ncbi:MAG: DUF4350 domain-containing protein [Acidobacteria bacterium]|nr:DUF4350 domain-containing protein [Acidobacteriota bacterium]
MPVPLEPGDRKILIAAGALLLVLMSAAALLTPPSVQGESFFPSTYATDPGGAKAAYLLLKELGYKVERWEQPASELPAAEGEAQGTLLILAQPFVPPPGPDQAALKRYFANGGRMLATGMEAQRLLGDLDDQLEVQRCESRWTSYPARLPSPVTRGAPRITLSAWQCWESRSSGPLVLYGDEKKAVVVTFPVGRGRVVWWAGSTPLTNAGLLRESNLALFLNSVGPPETTRVLWDEYHHGHHGSVTDYFGRTPLRWGLLQLGLVFLAVCWAYARRSGPVRAPVFESRLSPLEYVETVGDLYHRAHASASAVELSYQRFSFRLAQQLGLPARATPEQLHEAAARRLGRRDPELLRVLRRCEAARKRTGLSDDEALALVQSLHDYSRTLHLTPSAKEKR